MGNSEEKGLGLIFLIGFMGCGKTTLGRKLASRLGYEFIDLDHVLEAKAGMRIAEYFSSFGEDAFRQLESEILKTTAYPENAIISTGGGLPCFFDNMDWMNAHGTSFYINLSPKTLADRLEHEKNERPVLGGRKGEELVRFITVKLAEREGFYKKATVIADGININSAKAEELLRSEEYLS